VDSGVQNFLIQPGVQGGIIVFSTATTIGVTGNITHWRGVQELRFVLDGYVYKHIFGIMPLPPSIDGLLGMDFLLKMQATINLSKGAIRMAKGQKLICNPQNGGPSQDGGRQRGWIRRKYKERRPENSIQEEWETRVYSPPTKQYGSTPTKLSRKLYITKGTLSRRGRTRPTWQVPPTCETSQASRSAPTPDRGKTEFQRCKMQPSNHEKKPATEEQR
jgi:hypothetical protein